jgi:metal-sulfur cluster biosynthetic enzyme
VQPHKLDQGHDLRLRSTEQDRGAADAQPAGQHRKVEHQGGIGEHELAEVDDHIALGTNRARQRLPAAALGSAVFVASAPQGRRLVLEIDDCANLPIADHGFKGREVDLYTACMVSVEDVTDALRDVIDPELGLDFVELGLIYDVEVDGGTVRVTYTLTSPGCPIGPQVSEQIEEFVGELGGVEEVEPTMTFSPPWTPDRMSEDAKFALGF